MLIRNRSATLALPRRERRYLAVTCPADAGPGARYLFQVEETNRKIISLLARDGRMSFTELAKQTGLSVSAAQQRVRRLEERGVIKGYAALVNPDDAGLPLTAFISIKPFDPAAPDDVPTP